MIDFNLYPSHVVFKGLSVKGNNKIKLIPHSYNFIELTANCSDCMYIVIELATCQEFKYYTTILLLVCYKMWRSGEVNSVKNLGGDGSGLISGVLIRGSSLYFVIYSTR